MKTVIEMRETLKLDGWRFLAAFSVSTYRIEATSKVRDAPRWDESIEARNSKVQKATVWSTFTDRLTTSTTDERTQNAVDTRASMKMRVKTWVDISKERRTWIKAKAFVARPVRSRARIKTLAAFDKYIFAVLK